MRQQKCLCFGVCNNCLLLIEDDVYKSRDTSFTDHVTTGFTHNQSNCYEKFLQLNIYKVFFYT